MKSRVLSPIMNDQNDVSAKPKRLKPGVEISLVVDKAIAAVGRNSRVAHSHVVGRQAAARCVSRSSTNCSPTATLTCRGSLLSGGHRRDC